jgi:cytochrome bd-type quinol oxidase subunit 1
MSVYEFLRIVHSYWRWAVLIGAIVVLVRTVRGVYARREWTRADDRAVRFFAGALDLQVLLGLILYFFFSPFWPALYETFSETMRSPVARFFAVEHNTAMLIGAAVVHIGAQRAKRAAGASGKHRAMLIAMLIFFPLLLWAIPWPWREVGRPLFRMTP